MVPLVPSTSQTAVASKSVTNGHKFAERAAMLLLKSLILVASP